jgi:DNA adenine methylase
MQRGNAAYAFEMTNSDHVEMAEQLHRIKGMAIVSGYECDLYQHLFKDWKMVRKKAFADGAAERIECLWMNKNVIKHSNLLF